MTSFTFLMEEISFSLHFILSFLFVLLHFSVTKSGFFFVKNDRAFKVKSMTNLLHIICQLKYSFFLLIFKKCGSFLFFLFFYSCLLLFVGVANNTTPSGRNSFAINYVLRLLEGFCVINFPSILL